MNGPNLTPEDRWALGGFILAIGLSGFAVGVLVTLLVGWLT